MAGIYIHVPFCKQACNYCDFHFSTSLKNKEFLVKAAVKELILRKPELENDTVNSIYLGGGTPSLLTEKELSDIFNAIFDNYNISATAEITLEANPDDLTFQKINELKNTPVNRLSIGVQSFFNEDLNFMNRAHNAREAVDSVTKAQESGFENITVDLIYGIPLLTPENWEHNLSIITRLGVPHLSAYALTVETGTALYHQINKGKLPPLDEELAIRHFRQLSDWSKDNNFVHYEISNLGKSGFFSSHNTSYWKQEKYLGIGPAAHSFNGLNRRWNVRNNTRYIQSLEKGQVEFEQETLSINDSFNEYIMTSLRTIWGITREEITSRFGDSYWDSILKCLNDYLMSGEIIFTDNRYTLSENGKLVADKVAANLFAVE